MSKTLRATFPLHPHSSARHALLPLSSFAAIHSLEGLLTAMQHFLEKAGMDLLQPRQQVLDRIFREAALLH